MENIANLYLLVPQYNQQRFDNYAKNSMEMK